MKPSSLKLRRLKAEGLPGQGGRGEARVGEKAAADGPAFAEASAVAKAMADETAGKRG